MVPTFPSRLRAWLELCRISNLPTIWTNVLTGCAIAAGFGWRAVHEDGTEFYASIDWKHVAVMSLAMSLFYIAGMALNDLADVEIDRQERPHRPLPSGRIGRSAALNFILLFFSGGMAILWWYKPVSLIPAVFLLLFIIAYDFTHKRFASAVVFMGACRALVILIAATGPLTSPFIRIAVPLAAALAVYIICITIIARGETEDRIDGRRWLAIFMPLHVLAMVAVVIPAQLPLAAIAAFAVCLWLTRAIRHVFARPPKTMLAVLTWLSGICLVDGYFLALLGVPEFAAIAALCFLLTAWGHRKIVGT